MKSKTIILFFVILIVTFMFLKLETVKAVDTTPSFNYGWEDGQTNPMTSNGNVSRESTNVYAGSYSGYAHPPYGGGTGQNAYYSMVINDTNVTISFAYYLTTVWISSGSATSILNVFTGNSSEYFVLRFAPPAYYIQFYFNQNYSGAVDYPITFDVNWYTYSISLSSSSSGITASVYRSGLGLLGTIRDSYIQNLSQNYFSSLQFGALNDYTYTELDFDNFQLQTDAIILSSYGETSTFASQNSTVYTNWYDPNIRPIIGYVFATNNTGAWNNYVWGSNATTGGTMISFGLSYIYGTGLSQVNVTMTLYHDIGSTVSFWVWVNDTLGNSANSTTLSFILTTNSIAPSPPSQGINLLAIPTNLANLLGISVTIAGLLCGFMLEIAFVVPIIIFTDNPIVLTIFAILGLIAGVALGWLPYVCLILITLIIALLFADKIRKFLTSGEGEK